LEEEEEEEKKECKALIGRDIIVSLFFIHFLYRC